MVLGKIPLHPTYCRPDNIPLTDICGSRYVQLRYLTILSDSDNSLCALVAVNRVCGNDVPMLLG